MTQFTNNSFPEYRTGLSDNREVRDALELCDMTVEELARRMGISVDRCQRELDHGLRTANAKATLISFIYRQRYGDNAPDFSTLNEWRVYIHQEIFDRGSAWMKQPFLVTESCRHFHQYIQEIKRAGQKANHDRMKGETK